MRSLIPFDHRLFSYFCLLLFGLVVLGCGAAEPAGQVTGKITFQNQPVSEGEVGFLLEETGFVMFASLDDSGTFSFPQAIPVGTYKVMVTPPPLTDTAQGANAAAFTHARIPDKYHNELSSDLLAEVAEGENEFEFELQR